MTPKASNRRSRKCQLYVGGHNVHYIQALRSSKLRQRYGTLVAVVENVIVVEYLDKVGVYRNHRAADILKVASPGDMVRVEEELSILHVDMKDRASAHCFSIRSIDKLWTPCDYTPLKSADPNILAERIQTHGGFVVPGRAVLDAIQENRV